MNPIPSPLDLTSRDSLRSSSFVAGAITDPAILRTQNKKHHIRHGLGGRTSPVSPSLFQL